MIFIKSVSTLLAFDFRNEQTEYKHVTVCCCTRWCFSLIWNATTWCTSLFLVVSSIGKLQKRRVYVYRTGSYSINKCYKRAMLSKTTNIKLIFGLNDYQCNTLLPLGVTKRRYAPRTATKWYFLFINGLKHQIPLFTES